MKPINFSERMRRIRGKKTGPELRVRRLSHRLGYRHRLHDRNLPGRPDLVYPSRKKVIFVHGCFWHQHAGCKLSRTPKARPEYWIPKLERNQARDAENVAQAISMGWDVLIIWECETRQEDALAARLRAFLESNADLPVVSSHRY